MDGGLYNEGWVIPVLFSYIHNTLYQPPLMSDISLFILKSTVMNIAQLKVAIATKFAILLPSLMLVRQLNEETKAPEPWVSHWENDARIRITMHDDVLTKVKADPTFDGLAVKYQMVDATPDRAAYARAIIIVPANVEATF